MRKAILFTTLGLLALAIGWQLYEVFEDPKVLSPNDYVEYWAAGKLNRLGQNPYDPQLLYPLQHDEAKHQYMAGEAFGATVNEKAIMMWNPPWTLVVAHPLGMLKPRVGQFVWMGISFTILIYCSFQLWKIYGGAPGQWLIAILLGIFFIPCIYCLSFGQITFWLLLSLVVFTLLEERGYYYLAGAAAVPLAFKPHLIYLFWLVLALRAISDKNCRKIIAGGVAFGAVCSLLPMLTNPEVWSQYKEALKLRPPERFKTPTLGTLLREIDGMEAFAVQFIPLVLGLGWLAYYAWPRQGRSVLHRPWKDQLPTLVFASVFTCAYGAWPFDLVVLLPAVIHIAALLSQRPTRPNISLAAISWLIFTVPIVVMSINENIEYYHFVWATPGLWAWYVLLRHRSEFERRSPAP
jgi:hypothetical protein